MFQNDSGITQAYDSNHECNIALSVRGTAIENNGGGIVVYSALN